MIIVAVLSIPFIVVLLRRPVLRRLALRNATRRPRETLLVVLGSLLGTAIMTGSFVVGDTFDASIRRSAYEQLGPVDEIVSANGLAAGAVVRDRIASFHDRDVDGVLPLTLTRVAIATTGRIGWPRRSRSCSRPTSPPPSRSAVTRKASGLSGATPAPGEAAIGADLASALKAKVGSTIDAFAYGASVRLRVAQILPKRGIAGFWRGQESQSNNAFVAPGTIEDLVARRQGEVAARHQSRSSSSRIVAASKAARASRARSTPR